MKQVAFVTYRSIGEVGSISNGWHEGSNHRALVIQYRTKGEPIYDEPGYPLHPENESLFGQLREALPALDRIVVYFGPRYCQRLFTILAGVSSEKILFLGCDCDFDEKRQYLTENGMTEAIWIDCDHEGREAMKSLFAYYLKTARVLSPIRQNA